MERVINVVRLHLVDKWSYLLLPALILLLTFAINLLVFGLIKTSGAMDGPDYAAFSGGFAAPLVYLFTMAIMTINATFPFSQALSLTRREFFLGTSLFYTAFGIAFGILVNLCIVVERATGGWGVNLPFFGLPWVMEGGFFAVWFVCFAITQFVFYVGTFFATVYLRWRTNGILLAFAILILVSALLVTFATIEGWWPAVGAWFVARNNVSLMAWLLVPTIVAAAASFLVFRKTSAR